MPRQAPHPDFNFKVGDVVLRLPKTHSYGDEADEAESMSDVPAPVAATAATVAAAHATAVVARNELAADGARNASPGDELGQRSKTRPQKPSKAEGEEGEEGDEDGPQNLRSLGYIGEVVSIGVEVRVRWMDGSVGSAPPEELYVVNTDEEEEPLEEPPDESFDEVAPVTVTVTVSTR